MEHRDRTQARGETTRKAILGAAARLAREVGFDRMAIRDVCQAAGVTTGAFYHHFSSKEDLLTQGFASLDAFMETALAPYLDRPPLERLNILLRLYAQFIEGLGWQTISLYYVRRLSNPKAALSLSPNRYTFRAMEDCVTQLFEGEERVPFEPGWLSEFLFRHFRGSVVDWALHEGSYPLWPKLEKDYALFAAALRAPGEAE